MVFGANRSQTFGLALSLLEQYIEDNPLDGLDLSLEEMRRTIISSFS